MSNRVDLNTSVFDLPLGLCCPQWNRFVSSTVTPAQSGWESKGLSIGSALRSCYTSLTDPCIPLSLGAFTCPNNTTQLLWSAGNLGNVRPVGQLFGVADTSGPFSAATGNFYDTTASYTRVNARVTSSKSEPLWPYVAPTWPVWLARGLGASMNVPAGATAINTAVYNGIQVQYLWGLTDGMIVHPDDQVKVAGWRRVAGFMYPVGLNAPNSATGAAIGTTIPAAYTGVNGAGVTETARGLVVDLSNWLPSPAGSVMMKGFMVRS